MKEPLKDDEIVSLYRESASETPPAELDDRILNYAKSKTQGSVKISHRRNWWPVYGLVASVLLVTLLAPWRWMDETLQPAIEKEILENNLHKDNVNEDSAFEERAYEERKHEERVYEERQLLQLQESKQRSLKKVSPQVDLQADNLQMAPQSEVHALEAGKAETVTTLFNEVGVLLAAGEKEAAKEKLKQILQEHPEAEKQLPDELKALLTE